jgi:hypothetical protein
MKLSAKERYLLRWLTSRRLIALLWLHKDTETYLFVRSSGGENNKKYIKKDVWDKLYPLMHWKKAESYVALELNDLGVEALL